MTSRGARGSRTLAARLAARLDDLTYARLPAASKTAVKRLLLDYLGVTIAGSQAESGVIANKLARSGKGAAEATLIGNGARVPASDAAFANAISAHSIELDDIDVYAYFHFSPPVYSAALAAAEKARASGKQLILALAAGCEAMERVSRAANPSLRDRCYHSTPTCGVFGAAVAVGKLWKLRSDQLVSALGLAGAQASGILEFHGPSMQKRFSPGPAARGGVTAAHLALLGFTGQDTIFEGERGFLKAFTDRADPSQLVKDLRKPYRLDIEFKPYACARPIHNAIDCALKIRAMAPNALADVVDIEVTRHPSWAHKHQERAPSSHHAAQLSLPFCVVVALKDGQVLLEQFSDRNLKDPRVRELMKRTRITVDPSLPRGVSCRVVLTLADGRNLTAQVDYPKGSIQQPMSDEEIEAKFVSLAAPVVGKAAAGKIPRLVARLEDCDDVRTLVRLTGRSGTRR